MHELANNPEPQKKQNSELIIRGHHLYRFIDLLANVPSLKNDASETSITEVLLKELYEYSQKFVSNLKRNEPEYVLDVLGDSSEENEFIKNLIKQFLIFISQEPSYPVTLTTSIDGICNGCATGNHCHVLQKYDLVLIKRVARLLNKEVIQEDGGHLRLQLTLNELRELVIQKKV